MCDCTPTTRTVIARGTRGPHLARHFVAEALCAQHAEHLSTECMLVASSFTTNALQCGYPVTLELQCWQHAVVITATDPGQIDVRREARRRQVSMLLLDEVAQAWGAQATGDAAGRRQWALLSTDPVTGGGGLPNRAAAHLLLAGH